MTGTKSGRPLGRPKVGDNKVKRVIALARQGIGKRKTAAMVGVGVGTVQRILRELRGQ